jgi:hypothetical protein
VAYLDSTKRLELAVIDELALGREDEPVEVPIGRMASGLPTTRLELLDDSMTPVPLQITSAAADGTVTERSRLLFTTSFPRGMRERKYTLQRHEGSQEPPPRSGISFLDPANADGFRRLDTGRFLLELCRGTGRGGTASKWGIRHFEESSERLNLIKNDANAIGGVFGPFFTPENGFVNPPEHAIARIEVLEEGPLLCRYRFEVDVPDGLDPALRGARISIVWSFFYRSSWFDRVYEVTPYETTVDSIPVANQITVGDEFEGGKDVLLFSRFAAWPETVYRGGDPHSLVLFDVVRELLEERGAEAAPGLDAYRRAAEGGLQSESYDFRWRLLSIREVFAPVDLIKRYLREVQQRAGGAMRREIVEHGLRGGDEINVSEEGEETAFVRTADKTAMTSSSTGHAVLWFTSMPVRRYQIVQSRRSGWVNWGTNGENEYPELPSGSLIRMSYGRFSDPSVQVRRMESPVVPQWIESGSDANNASAPTPIRP